MPKSEEESKSEYVGDIVTTGEESKSENVGDIDAGNEMEISFEKEKAGTPQSDENEPMSAGKDESNNDDSSSIHNKDDGKTIEQQLEELRAEKVEGMIDPIYDNGQLHSHMIYLTNWQANVISNNKESTKMMIDTFCGDNKPGMIIHLVQSWGFYNSTKVLEEGLYNQKINAGIEHNTPPFKNDEELNTTMARMNRFMSKLIPLAEKTSAIIFCNAVADDCILTETFFNALQMEASRWNGGPMPFTVIKIMDQVECLYMKEKEHGKYINDQGSGKKSPVKWTTYMNQCANWQHRHESILKEHFQTKMKKSKEQNCLRGHDLDWSIGDLIVVEALDKSWKKNKSPAALLLTSIMDTYHNIPTLAIKTGATPRLDEDFNRDAVDIMGLPYLVNRVNSDTHVICLDVRKRPKKELFEDLFGEDSCLKLVDKPSEELSKVEDDLEEKAFDKNITDILFPDHPNYESLDCCALSFLDSSMKKFDEMWDERRKKREKEERERHLEESDTLRKLRRNGRIIKWLPRRNDKKIQEQKSLKELIREKQEENSHSHNTRDKRASIYFNVSYQFSKEFRNQFGDTFDGKYTHRMATFVQELLMSKVFHSMNIWDPESSFTTYIEENIVLKYHRTSKIPPYEGLKLLQKAWELVDKTRTDADGYRRLCYFLILSQLFLGILITIASAISTQELDNNQIQTLKSITLAFTLLLTAVVSIESLLTPKMMWRQLRLASVELESLIWKYRAGVGKFDPGLETSRDAENNFDEALTEWRNSLHGTLQNVGGTKLPHDADYPSPSVRCRVPSRIIQLFNNTKWTSEEWAKEGEDNHYSYVLSKDYLSFRLEKLIEIFQSRVPKSVWSQQMWQLSIIALGVVIAFISETNVPFRPEIVLILTAIVAAFKSWSGFKDIEGNSQLYPPAINAWKNKQREWDKRTKHQQQDLKLFGDLVDTIESIGINAVESWSKSLSERKYVIPGVESKQKNGENPNAVDENSRLDA